MLDSAAVVFGNSNSSFFMDRDGLLAFVTVLGGLSWGLGYLGQPHLIIRYMAIRDAKDINVARSIAIAWAIPGVFGAFMIGIISLSYFGPDYFQVNDPEKSMPLLAAALLHPVLAGLFISGAVAAMMSTADSKAIAYLIDMAGESIVHLNNEIDKICLLIEPRQYIEIEDLKQFSGWRRERGLWEFLLAYSSKNFEKSVEIGKSLIQGSNQFATLIIQLTNLYQEMLFVKMKKNGTFDSFSGYIALPASIKKRIRYIAADFSKKEIIEALDLLHGIDKRKKSQTTDDEVELIQFIGKTIG